MENDAHDFIPLLKRLAPCIEEFTQRALIEFAGTSPKQIVLEIMEAHRTGPGHLEIRLIPQPFSIACLFVKADGRPLDSKHWWNE